jgi:hypothetical protein
MENNLNKLYFWIFLLFGVFSSLGNCNSENICEKYKNTACENTNSGVCHDAMKKYPDLSPFECQEKIKILKTEVYKTTSAL